MTKSNLLKLLHLMRLSSVLRFSKKNYLTILSLHRISDEEDLFFYPISPRQFEKLIEYVLKHYSVTSFSELSEPKTAFAKPPLILSFDDGYYDFYEYALPILSKYDLPSNHNIVIECASDNKPIWTQRLNNIFNHCRINNITLRFETDQLNVGIDNFDKNWIKYNLEVFRHLLQMPKPSRIRLLDEKEKELSLCSKNKMMNWEEIAECSRHKVEIGSHTHTHDALSTITEQEILEFEITKSKAEIERRINLPVNVFALPNGQGNTTINNFVQQAGYKYLLYVNDGINKLTDIADNELNIFSRINLVNESHSEMILRTELFHAKVRKYV